MTPHLQASHAPVCTPQQAEVTREVSPRVCVNPCCCGYTITVNNVTTSVTTGARGSVNRYSSLCSTRNSNFRK